MTNVSVRSNVKMLLINVRKVCELVLHCLICLTLKWSTKLCYTCVGSPVCMALHAYMRLFCNKPCLKFGLQRELCMVGILKLRMLSQVN